MDPEGNDEFYERAQKLIVCSMLRVRILSYGTVEWTSIPQRIVELCVHMSSQIEDYFCLKAAVTYVPAHRIVLSRLRPEGVVNARIRMQEAAAGVRAKRLPVRARKLGDDYLIEDGNSTTTVLLAIGVARVPIVEVQSQI